MQRRLLAGNKIAWGSSYRSGGTGIPGNEQESPHAMRWASLRLSLVTFQITSFPERDLKQEAVISLDHKSMLFNFLFIHRHVNFVYTVLQDTKSQNKRY